MPLLKAMSIGYRLPLNALRQKKVLDIKTQACAVAIARFDRHQSCKKLQKTKNKMQEPIGTSTV